MHECTLCLFSVYLGVQLHVRLLLVVVPQLLRGLGFLWQVRLLPLLNQLGMLLPAGQLMLAMLHTKA